MPLDTYSNNAIGKLSEPRDSGAMFFAMVDEPSLANFKTPGPGEIQRATLSHISRPGDFEVVYITARSGLNFTVERGRENTTAKEWPAETKLEARITAGMLNQLLTSDGEGKYWVRYTDGTPSPRFVVNSAVDWDAPQALHQISGAQVLQRTPLKVMQVLDSGFIAQDLNMSGVSVGASPFLDLGAVAAPWAANNYYARGALVTAPQTPGHVWMLDSTQSFMSMSATSPAFHPSVNTVPATHTDGVTIGGQWVKFPDPFSLRLSLPARLVLSEVGFVCDYFTGTTPPSVSFGLLADGDLVPATALTSLAAESSIHRIAVNPAGALPTELRIKVNAIANGQCTGRFYWRGFFVAP